MGVAGTLHKGEEEERSLGRTAAIGWGIMPASGHTQKSGHTYMYNSPSPYLCMETLVYA